SIRSVRETELRMPCSWKPLHRCVGSLSRKTIVAQQGLYHPNESDVKLEELLNDVVTCPTFLSTAAADRTPGWASGRRGWRRRAPGGAPGRGRGKGEAGRCRLRGWICGIG